MPLAPIRCPCLFAVACLLMAAGSVPPARGQDCVAPRSRFRVYVPNGSLEIAAAVHLDTAVFGEVNSNEGSWGSVRVLVRDEPLWDTEGTFRADDTASGDRFGASVDLREDLAVVGAPGDDHGMLQDAGSAYLFERTGGQWTQTLKLTAEDAADYDEFGIAVAMDRDTVVVGAHLDDDAGLASGSVYGFVYSDGAWSPQGKLQPLEARSFARFGASLSLSDDTVVVGAPGDRHDGIASGAAYVFIRSGTGWNQTARLSPPQPDHGDEFGASVAISGDTLVVGAPGVNHAEPDSGAIHVFTRSDGVWTLQTILTAPDAAASDRFGHSVAIDGNAIVAGSPQDDDWSPASGAAHVFTRSDADSYEWTTLGKISAGRPAPGAEFGSAVGVSGVTVIATAPSEKFSYNYSNSPVYAGVVYFHQIVHETTPDCNENAVSDECDIVNLDSPDCNANDVPDECDIAEMVSADCNLNEVPDECDLDVRTSPDCNRNIVPDECDVAFETSLDCNANDIPDECDVYGATFVADLRRPAIPSVHIGYAEAVSLSDKWAAIGAPNHHNGVPGTGLGALFLFRKNDQEWGAPSLLRAGKPGDRFGHAVALFEQTMIVGAIGAGDAGHASGSAHVFREEGANWAPQQRLAPEDGGLLAQFGWAVAATRDILFVGAPGDGTELFDSGSVYVYVRDGDHWLLRQKLAAPDPSQSGRFGSAVAASGNLLVIGAPLHQGEADSSGAAFAFRRYGGAWIIEEELLADDGATGDFFGESVAVFGDLAIVGASRHDSNRPDGGAAYVFRRKAAGWNLERKLVSPFDPSAYRYGISVAASAKGVAIGGAWDQGSYVDYGFVDVWRWTGLEWVHRARMAPDQDGDADSFGAVVALFGDLGVAGAPTHQLAGHPLGAAYAFRLTDVDCNDNGIPDECDLADPRADLFPIARGGDGVLDECQIVQPDPVDGRPHRRMRPK